MRVFQDTEYPRFDLLVHSIGVVNPRTVVAVRDNKEGKVLEVWLDKEELENLYKHLGNLIMELNRNDN